MLSSIILARSLASEDFAAFNYFQLTVSMMAAFSAMGFGLTASRYFSEIGRERVDDTPFPVGTLWVMSILLSMTASVVVFLLPESIVGAGFSIPRWMLALGVFAVCIQIVPNGAALGLERYKSSSLISLFSAFCTLGMVFIASRTESVVWAMSAVILASLSKAVGESVLVFNVVGMAELKRRSVFTYESVRRIFQFAGPMVLVTILASSGTWLLGRIILEFSEDRLTFSVYSIGLQWFALALLIPGVLSRVILPKIVRGNILSNKKLVRQGVGAAMAISSMTALLGFAFSSQLIQVYGIRFLSYELIPGSFMVAAAINSPANIVGNLIIAGDGQKYWLIITGAWLTTLLLSGLVFAEKFGGFAGAIALTFGALVHTFSAVYVARRKKLI